MINHRDTIRDYDHRAEELLEQYESVAFENVHEAVLDLIPQSSAFVLDLGAGSGRDAAWFAAHGHDVVAVEPAYRLQQLARQHHRDAKIQWMADSLPDLRSVIRTGNTFDLIWLSAVWMHITPGDERARVFRKLVTLLRPSGQIMITLRKGPSPDNRPMHVTSAEEVEKLARAHGLITTRHVAAPDALARGDVSWETLWLQLPDDGLGALPLLRHIILNDNKASTYKLALLRVLVRIADSATGLAKDLEVETVAIPLGLVALYWIRAYKPLLDAGLPQKPASRTGSGLGFARDGFHALKDVSPFSLRLGARFTAQRGAALLKAMRDAKNTITRMPAHYITYPGHDQPVFVTHSKTPPRSHSVTLDAAFLWSFGAMHIPRHIWQAMARYAPWIEPVLLNEWVALMRGYEGAQANSRDDHLRQLQWLDPVHDTAGIRELAKGMRASGTDLHCVWTGTRLRHDFAIDHCLPFAAWPCNDLWNLLPARPTVNQQKSDRLPSAEALFQSRQRILDWWGTAYLARSGLDARFMDEATAALPRLDISASHTDAEDIFAGLMMQRTVLKRDQQLREWSPR